MSSGLLPAGFTVIGQLIAPSGTRIPFNQAAPPLGWTQEVGTAYNDTTLRVNSSSPSTGGSTVWSSWNFGGTFNFNGFGLSIAQMAVHSHTINGDSGHSHACPGGFSFWAQGSGAAGLATTSLNTLVSSFGNTAVGSAGISMGNTGSGSAITPNITTPQVKYTDMIIGIKS